MRTSETGAACQYRSVALVHRHVIAFRVAGVHLARTADFRVRIGEHLTVLRDPAGDAAQREQRGEHGRIEADRTVDQSRVEVDVRIQMTRHEVIVAQCDLLQFGGHVEQRALVRRQLQRVGAFHDLLQIGLGDRRARIVRLVHAVAEAGDATPVGLRVLHEFLDGFAGVADCLELALYGQKG